MRMLFIRLDEKNFFLRPGLSRGCGDERMIRLLKSELRVYVLRFEVAPLNEINWERWEREERFANKVVHFAKSNPEYVFWEIFDFYGGKFSYSVSKELFFENKRQGAHLNDVLEEMKKRSIP